LLWIESIMRTLAVLALALALTAVFAHGDHEGHDHSDEVEKCGCFPSKYNYTLACSDFDKEVAINATAQFEAECENVDMCMEDSNCHKLYITALSIHDFCPHEMGGEFHMKVGAKLHGDNPIGTNCSGCTIAKQSAGGDPEACGPDSAATLKALIAFIVAGVLAACL
jgi:hypothetical protein